ncbi:twin-arginine translocase subunit TatB [Corynebacterium poyangense]|uniref:Twin-arginine translocase subunit TatB n=1 Tax=Corynebacterium poyangense TaxID=2684405 RepID=A0A7H0SN78_9CORY|nr:twin-arginine translocase subunit TatB [Corynebacterium poyangense]MBZ8177025.1 twin-arginine translocase subunit TatB [Corynebacterium poyangense]QNQ90003.1 twin-arginine translocase subunit TatB [Corynebacterium poyangense]
MEIITLLVLGLIVIGPERLPGVITDVRAAIYAARKAINNAKAELDGEFQGIGEEFEEFRQPLSQIARIQRMGPKAAITRALFEDDENFLDSFDPKKVMKGETQGEAFRKQQSPTPESEQRPVRDSEKPPRTGGFSWDDIT